METSVLPNAVCPVDAALILRVNQLYHELTQASFDEDHRRRHRVECPFWRRVAGLTLAGRTAGRRLSAPPPAAGPCGRVVVDLACGTGFVAEAFRPYLRSSDRLIAVDVCEKALATTAMKWDLRGRRGAAGARLGRLTADARHLPLADRSVDLLAINASLHHMPDPPAVLREVDRVLAPGGWFALGFEPNRAHCASGFLSGLSRGLARAGWYASPCENRRRLRQWVRRSVDRGADGGDVLTAVINNRLVRDGLISAPLSLHSLLDLVDPHARGARAVAGFDPVGLIRGFMPTYAVCLLRSSDYLGPSGRPWPPVRGLVDAALRSVVPLHGSLFSWLIRKPDSRGAGGGLC